MEGPIETEYLMKNWNARDYALMVLFVALGSMAALLMQTAGLNYSTVHGFLIRTVVCGGIYLLGYHLACKQAAARIAKEKNAKRPE